jgi:hypothetical protein
LTLSDEADLPRMKPFVSCSVAAEYSVTQCVESWRGEATCLQVLEQLSFVYKHTQTNRETDNEVGKVPGTVQNPFTVLRNGKTLLLRVKPTTEIKCVGLPRVCVCVCVGLT